MYVAAVAISLVALGSLAVCASSIRLLGRMHQATISLLADTLSTSADQLTRTQQAVGSAVGDAAWRTSTAIGEAVQRAQVTPVPAASLRDDAYVAARDLVAGDYRADELDDMGTDPTDWSIHPDRVDSAVISGGDRNPTGVPGFAFTAPAPMDVLAGPYTALNGNGHG